MIPTVPVTCIASDQNGNLVAGAVYTAVLNQPEIYQGFVVPETVTATSNALGIAVLNLWPNALGVAGSMYTIRAVNPDKKNRFLNATVAVPNSPCNLHNIITVAPYPPVDASQQALAAAQGALALVTAQADIAAANAALTAADVALTHADVVVTGADADAAHGDMLAAQADAVQTALDRIAVAEDAAQTALDALATAADRAQTTLDAAATAADRVQTGLDRTAASGSAATASGQAVIATDMAGDAAASAAAADAAAGSITASAATATTKAGEASASAASSAASAVTATTQAGNAATSASTATTQASTATTKAGEALSSANAAAASYDSFDDRYLGAKAAAPTLDNDGAALLTGALYWDTALGALRVWTGAAWTNTTELDDRVLADQQLLGGISYATDMALQAVRELVSVPPQIAAINANVATYDLLIEQVLNAMAHLLDLAGVTARAIAGGDVLLRAGTAALPSLMPTGDANTGLFFPAADVVAAATGGIERWRVDANGYNGFATTTPTGVMDINDNRARIRTAKTPASATAAGNAGEFCWDASYFYICTSTNVWRRTAHATW